MTEKRQGLTLGVRLIEVSVKRELTVVFIRGETPPAHIFSTTMLIGDTVFKQIHIVKMQKMLGFRTAIL